MSTSKERRRLTAREEGTPCSCAGNAGRPRPVAHIRAAWIDGTVATASGGVARVRTAMSPRDRLGTLKARMAIGRMDYRVPPGLYCTGNPGPESPVMVSANYKLSFDHLRVALAGRDAWILVLDTHGVNVWCAAGKGTFSTDEVVRRVAASGLEGIVSHRKLVLPQLGATGVSAHQVRDRCGFRVIYGPVRALDLPAFIDAGMNASPAMRRVTFDIRDRATLIPVEIMTGGKYFLLAAAAILLLGGLGRVGYSFANVRETGLVSGALVLGAFAGSAILGPLLLPWLPGRAFSIKGAVLGLALVGALAAGGGIVAGTSGPWLPSGSWFHAAAWALIVPAIASFTVMTFTGSTTFTSLSGVLREMRFGVPAQIAGGAIGLGLWVVGLFLRGGR